MIFTIITKLCQLYEYMVNKRVRTIVLVVASIYQPNILLIPLSCWLIKKLIIETSNYGTIVCRNYLSN